VARSRNIKPSLYKNELLGEADPLLTILFTGLWCLADRDGLLEDRPKRIKAEIFPYREELDINGYLTELERMQFIHRYEADNTPCIQVLNFKKHQSPHKTEKPSELPEPPLKTDSCLLTDKAPLNTETPTVKESLIPDSLIPDSLEGADKPPRAKKKKEFEPPSMEEVVEYFRTNGYPKDLATRAFSGYAAADWHDSSGKKIISWKQKMQHVWFKPDNKSTRDNDPAKGAI
jgi:hypothetical protein